MATTSLDQNPNRRLAEHERWLLARIRKLPEPELRRLLETLRTLHRKEVRT